jgi:predicted TIM-barrel fold metal-dependent hydrolase
MPVLKEADRMKLPVFVHPQIINPIGFERVDDPLLTPVVEYVFDITVCIGRLMMSEVLSRLRDIRLIFANFGGVICHLSSRFDSTYGMLRQIGFVKDLKVSPSVLLKHIYVDTGGDTSRTNLLAALDFLGPGHVLWGSDWPAKKDIAASLKAVEEAGFSKKDRDGILGDNLKRILGS